MHLLESQSTQSAQSISKPEVYEKFIPLPFPNKYIVFAPHSKESKTYDFWPDVLSILVPILNKNNIVIIQIGAQNERQYNGCYPLMGQTSVNQVAFLIKNSIGVLSTDTFAQHLADSYGVKSTVLISNNYSNNVRGYFNPNQQTILEPPREEGEKPCLTLQEIPKSINKLKPEDIARVACEMLELPFDFSYQTLYTGEISFINMIISCCDSVVNNAQFGVQQLIIDLTLNHNEQILAQQLQVCECSIICNRPVNLDLIKSFRPRIKEIVYIIESLEFSKPDFVKEVQKLGLNCRVMSNLDKEIINGLKLEWMEVAVINKQIFINPQDILALKNEDLNSLWIKSSKYYLSSGSVYPSKAHLAAKKNIQSFEDIVSIENTELLWKEVESFKILKKIS